MALNPPNPGRTNINYDQARSVSRVATTGQRALTQAKTKNEYLLAAAEADEKTYSKGVQAGFQGTG